jgi:hypothetical protein
MEHGSVIFRYADRIQRSVSAKTNPLNFPHVARTRSTVSQRQTNHRRIKMLQ